MKQAIVHRRLRFLDGTGEHILFPGPTPQVIPASVEDSSFFKSAVGSGWVTLLKQEQPETPELRRPTKQRKNGADVS